MKFTKKDFLEGKVAIQGDGSQTMKNFLNLIDGNSWIAGKDAYYYFSKVENKIITSIESIIKMYTFMQRVQFKDLQEKEFVLPEKWYIEVNRENQQTLGKWRSIGDLGSISGYILSHYPYDSMIGYWQENKPNEGKLITFDQFKQFVLKEQPIIYTPEYIKENKIAIHCSTEEEYLKIKDFYNMSLSNSWHVYKNNTVLYPQHNLYGNLYGQSSIRNESTIIEASTILNQNTTKEMETTNKKIIGYRLIKPEYTEAVVKIEGSYDMGMNIRDGRTILLTDDNSNIDRSGGFGRLKKAGVLDLWFEPVYEEDKRFIPGTWLKNSKGDLLQFTRIDGDRGYYKQAKNDQIDWFNVKGVYPEQLVLATPTEIATAQTKTVSVGGAFDVIIKGKEVFRGNDNITAFIRTIHQMYTHSINCVGYDVIMKDVIFSKTGSQNKETKLSDWKKIYDMIKD